MKTTILVVCLFAISVYGLSPEMEEEIKDIIRTYAYDCREKVGATDEDMAKLRDYQVPDSTSGKCFVACMNKRFGWQDPNGKIDKESAFATIERMKPIDGVLYEKMKTVATACFAQVKNSDDECQTAYDLAVCYDNENKHVGIQEIRF